MEQFIDDNGVTCFIDDNGVSWFVDDAGNELFCDEAAATPSASGYAGFILMGQICT